MLIGSTGNVKNEIKAWTDVKKQYVELTVFFLGCG